MVPMFAPQWKERVKRELKRHGPIRFATFRSLVYSNPHTGAQMRTAPMLLTPRDVRDMVRTCKASGYIPCYVDKVTLDV